MALETLANSSIAGNPARRLVRTALLAWPITWIVAAVLWNLGSRNESYDRGVLEIFSATIGVVGSFWALSLLMRAALHGAQLIVPFIIALALTCILSIPMLGAWKVTGYEHLDAPWEYFHLTCATLFVPLIALTTTAAAPFFAWRYWCARDRPDPVRAALIRRAWRTLFWISGVLFAVALPFAFYAFGASRPWQMHEHWTTQVALKMPHWFGDRVFDALPRSDTVHISGMLILRRMVTPGSVIRNLESSDDRGYYFDVHFEYFRRVYPAEALAWARTQFKYKPLMLRSSGVAEHFAEHAGDEEVKAQLTLPRCDLLNASTRRGLLSGLSGRKNANVFLPQVETLLSGHETTRKAALHFIVDSADDDDAKRIYLTLTGEDLQYATSLYSIPPRGNAITAALMQADPEKRKQTLRALLASISQNSQVQIARLQSVPACKVAFARALDSGNRTERLMSALLIHFFSNELTSTLAAQYKVVGRRLEFDVEHLENMPAANDAKLIEDARKMLNYW